MTAHTNNSDFQQTATRLFAAREKVYETEISPKNKLTKNYVGLYSMGHSSQAFSFRLNKQTNYSWQENGRSVPNFYQYIENLLGLFYGCQDASIVAYVTQYGNYLLPLLEEAPSIIKAGYNVKGEAESHTKFIKSLKKADDEIVVKLDIDDSDVSFLGNQLYGLRKERNDAMD